MRLGDLDALKEDLKQYFSDGTLDSVSAKLAFNMILRKIDNAPTVKFSLMPADETKEDAYKRGYERGKVEGILKGNKRPQGEWIKEQVTPASCTYVCSECGIEEVILSNFCRYCGAKMKGGTE